MKCVNSQMGNERFKVFAFIANIFLEIDFRGLRKLLLFRLISTSLCLFVSRQCLPTHVFELRLQSLLSPLERYDQRFFSRRQSKSSMKNARGFLQKFHSDAPKSYVLDPILVSSLKILETDEIIVLNAYEILRLARPPWSGIWEIRAICIARSPNGELGSYNQVFLTDDIFHIFFSIPRLVSKPELQCSRLRT